MHVLQKGIVTVGVIDNLDLSPSSTTAQDSFHGTAVSMIFYCTIENPGEIRPIQFSTNPSLKEADLPEFTELRQQQPKKSYH